MSIHNNEKKASPANARPANIPPSNIPADQPLRSMTGFGRCCLEEDEWTQTWEIRSVNSKHLDLKWRLPSCARSLESRFEKCVRRFAGRGRVEISLHLQSKSLAGKEGGPSLNIAQAEAMLDAIARFAAARGEAFTPDYNRLLELPNLWEEEGIEAESSQADQLEKGLEATLADWNEAREEEARALERDILARILRMEEWVAVISDRAPQIKEDRFALIRDRVAELLENMGSELESARFLQEIALLSDKLDVSEELTRLEAHLASLRSLLRKGADAGRRLDFTMQECFREINTCGNKIQDSQISRLVVEFKNELEKCREQVQNIE